jgi:hypothetical protein
MIIDYILEITKTKECKVTVGMFRDYTITLQEYDLFNLEKELIFS